MPETGIRVDGKFYPLPSSFRLGETRMIKRITGLNPAAFNEALNELDETSDPDVYMALVWWIMHREDPSISVEQLDQLEFGQIVNEDGDEVAPSDPKANGAPSASSPISVSASSTSPDAPGETIPANGGVPELAHYGLPT